MHKTGFAPGAAPARADARGRSTARFEEKRDAILDGAARLFNQHGIAGGTLTEAARRVGLATNSLTYYYRRKEDLASACLLRTMDTMERLADAAAAADAALTGRVRGFVERHLALLADIAEGRHPELIVFTDVLALGPPHDATLQAAYTQMFRRVRRLLEAADAPPLTRGALNARAHLVLSAASWTRAWFARHEPGDHALVAAQVGALLCDGLAADGVALARPALPAEPLLPAADDRGTAYLCAASRLVNRHGYPGASVDRIATELGLTKGSFYHHHDTKEALIAACFARTFDAMRRAQDIAATAPGRGLDRLALACRLLLRHQMSEAGPLLRISAWNALPEALRLDTQRTMTRLGDRFGRFVVEGIADGSVRALDPAVVAQVVNGMINAAAELERWAPGTDAGGDDVFDLFARPLFAGLRQP